MSGNEPKDYRVSHSISLTAILPPKADALPPSNRVMLGGGKG